MRLITSPNSEWHIFTCSMNSYIQAAHSARAATSCSDRRERIKCRYEKWWVSNEALVSLLWTPIHCVRFSFRLYIKRYRNHPDTPDCVHQKVYEMNCEYKNKWKTSGQTHTLMCALFSPWFHIRFESLSLCEITPHQTTATTTTSTKKGIFFSFKTKAATSVANNSIHYANAFS